ncbi:MAG TPA: RuBisCO large subunit C-terminal-like domain-containing protein [Nitrospiraceae bacterium]|nr:RuBisCO large subunit C-terminal-like domain-containing protein [Nitrospiraceae bacterium]
MQPSQFSPSLSGNRFAVEYQFAGNEAEARRNAELVCIDQTVEAPAELISEGFIRDQILGRIEHFQPSRPSGYEAVISFPVELLNGHCSQLLNVAFGITSLKRGIRLTHLHLPDIALHGWTGPRFGRTGVRDLVGIQNRPLVCGVLKPLGLPIEALADLAYQFALGGLDLIKDDQGLVDQPFCPFHDRVARCAEAVARAGRDTGRPCLYMPHVTGRWQTMHERGRFARGVGAGGLLISPGLTGFDALQDIAQDSSIGLPILSHPALLGSYMTNPESGIDPAVLFGQLPRLAGTDAVLYPTYGSDYAMSLDDCRRIAQATEEPWGPLKPTFPTAAGRMNLQRVPEMREFYGKDVIFILGSSIQRQKEGLVNACRRFIEQVEAS